MKKMIQFLIAIALVVAVVFGAFGISRIQLKKESTSFKSGTWVEKDWNINDEFNPDDSELYHTIDVEKGKDFTLLVVTDMHYRNDGWYGNWTINFQNTQTDKDLKKLKELAKPDLIIAIGDIQTGSLNDKNFENFVEIMDEIGVPWSFTFGNHDGEHRADKPAIMNIIQKSKLTVFKPGPTNLGIDESEVIHKSIYNEKISRYAGGLGNTVINLREKETGLIYYSFILMDTGDWQNMHGNMTAKNRLEVGERPFSRVGVGLTNRQIEWYKWVIDGLEKYNSKKNNSENTAPPETMLICHIGMKVLDYATILSQYENSYNGEYVKGGYDNNDLPFHTEAEWSRPLDRSYIEYDGSNNEITSNEEIMSKVKEFSKNAKEKEANAAISQYWILADNKKRDDYINGKNEDFPTPKKIAELVPIIDKGYAIHRENDVFLSAVIEKGSTKRVVTGHNHCDGYEVLFDGITYTSVVKTGSIYVDKDCDMENRGGSKFVITNSGGKVNVTSTAVYTMKNDYKSTRFPRPVEDF